MSKINGNHGFQAFRAIGFAGFGAMVFAAGADMAGLSAVGVTGERGGFGLSAHVAAMIMGSAAGLGAYAARVAAQLVEANASVKALEMALDRATCTTTSKTSLPFYAHSAGDEPRSDSTPWQTAKVAALVIGVLFLFAQLFLAATGG